MRFKLAGDRESLPAQLELCQKYAEEQGMEIVEEFTDVESAKDTGRKEFGRMLRLVQKDPETAIVVEKTDRLYRNYTDAERRGT